TLFRSVLDPELADGLVRVRQRETAGGLGMREAGGIEIHADADGFGPVNPALEMFGADLIAVHFFAAEIAVKRVQVEAMLAGNERQRLLGVGTEFLRGAGFA